MNTATPPLRVSGSVNFGSRILIADDEKNIRLMVRTILELEDHVVDEAADGNAAVTALHRASYDLLILDLNMPAVDGLTVLEQLETNKPAHLPKVVVLTAYGSLSTAVKATRRGALDFLEKPVTPDQLREAVKGALSEQERATTPPEFPNFKDVLDRIRTALKVADITTAETLLLHAVDLGQDLAGYFNLLGVLYEIRGQKRLARKMYSKAFGAEPGYPPAEVNLRRLYELDTFGRTTQSVDLGDSVLESSPVRHRHSSHKRNITMLDLIYVSASVGFFLLSALYVAACQRL